MKRIDALRLATRINNVVKTFPRHNRIVADYQNLIEEGYNQPESKIIKWYEILIFGSVVRKCDDETVGDLDMIFIDNGVASPHCEIDYSEEDWYFGLRGNLHRLLESESINCNNAASALLVELEESQPSIDLHILPLKFFKNKEYRMEVMRKHKDPDFFKNCFNPILRLRKGKQFVPVTTSYFEYKYKCDLRDMKK